MVYLKISPMKGVMRFDKKGKWSPQYKGPYEVLQRVLKVSYEFKVPSQLSLIDLVFHVSMLKKCIGDPVSVIPLEVIWLSKKLSYEDVPIEILDRQIKKLKNTEVASVKVQWTNHLVEGAT